MPIEPAQNPLVNGVYYSAMASIDCAVAGKDRNITAINFADSVDTKDVRTNATIRAGIVITNYKVDTCDFEMPLPEAEELIQDLGTGFAKVKFPIVVRYSIDGESTITRTLEEVRIKKAEHMHPDGDAVKMKFTCDVRRIKYGDNYLI